MRAYARDLGMSQTLLSLVLSGRRPLTLKQAHKIAALLQLNSHQQKTFLDSTLQALPENAKITQKIKLAKDRVDSSFMAKDVDVEKFHLIANWYHFAIMDLTTTAEFQSNQVWIAERLGITKLEVEAALERLSLLGLLTQVKGVWKKPSLHLKVPTHESKAAIRAFHNQMIEKARDELKKTDVGSFQKRSITGTSMAIDVTKLEDAKKFIREFEEEFVRRFTTGVPSEVYQLNVQLFPLTQKLSLKGSKV